MPFQVGRNPKTFEPLVSLLVYNFNYGRYLAECFDSMLAQSYSNIEIIFSDNASTDQSWEIACAYAKKHPGKIHLARNKMNLGTDANLANCHVAKRGNFYCIVGSDDILHPDFVKTCVAIMMEDPDLMYVMTHRFILDEKSRRTDEPPFYNGSYKLYPPSQNTVYMMAAINPSISQVMYRAETPGSLANIFNGQFYSARISDFLICLQYPVAYLDLPLVGHRIHGQNQSLIANSNLMEIIGPYVLLHQFSELARAYEYDAVIKKYDEGVIQISRLSLRYATRALLEGNNSLFERYFYLAKAIYPEIRYDKKYEVIGQFNGENFEVIRSELKDVSELDFGRKRTYEPSPPFEAIRVA